MVFVGTEILEAAVPLAAERAAKVMQVASMEAQVVVAMGALEAVAAVQVAASMAAVSVAVAGLAVATEGGSADKEAVRVARGPA